MLDQALSEIKDIPTQEKLRLSIQSTRGYSLHQLGYYYDAENALLESKQLAEKIYGVNDYSMVYCYERLADLYRDQKRYAAAEQYALKTVAYYEKANPDPPTKARALFLLSKIYMNERKEKEFIVTAKRLLAVYQTFLEPIHPDIAFIHISLGASYYDLKNYTEAEKNLKTAISIYDQLYNPLMESSPEQLAKIQRMKNTRQLKVPYKSDMTSVRTAYAALHYLYMKQNKVAAAKALEQQAEHYDFPRIDDYLQERAQNR